MNNNCRHCGLDSQGDEFCCSGCKLAYQMINNLGLQNYYQQRLIDKEKRSLKPENIGDIDISQFVTQDENNLNLINLMVDGMHCAACIWLIESVLKKQPAVVKARINMSNKRLHLEWVGDKKIGNDLVKIIFDLGYRLLPFDIETLEQQEKKYDNAILKALAVAGFAAGNVMLISVALWSNSSMQMGVATRNLLYWVSALIAMPAIIYSGRIFFVSAISSIKHGRMNMDVPIMVAITLASIISIFEAITKGEHAYFDSVIMLIFFLLIGRYLDFSARKKAFFLTGDLIMLNSVSATIIENGQNKIIANKNLKKDMVLLVAMGDKIAADGVVINGQSEIDTAVITGESLPKKVVVGDEVFAGMINLGSALQVRVTKTQDQTLLAQIIKMVEDVEKNKSHYTKIADQVAKYYTPLVHILALSTFLFWCFIGHIGWHKALLNAAAVLIITCPCALALAIPTVQIAAAARLLRKGVLLKNGEALEKLNKINTIVFDKTGTLTIGKPELIDIKGDSSAEILQMAASLAAKSKHVLSQALLKSFKGDLLNFDVEEVAGSGLIANYNNHEIRLGNLVHCCISDPNFAVDIKLPQIYFKYQDRVTVFIFQDQLREDAKLVVEQLKNKRIILLSGDKKSVVADVAKSLNISEYYFKKNPLEKCQILQKLKLEGSNILMVGDGINDAPSLMLADLSISPASAADISKNIADIVFQGLKLQPILEVINVAKKSNLLIKENLALSIIYNLIAIPFAVTGHIVPLFAALAMSSSSIVVVLNSLRVGKGIAVDNE